MRPIIILALIVVFIIGCVCVYNLSLPAHDDIRGVYAYGGDNLIIQNNAYGTYGSSSVQITEIKDQYNTFNFYSQDSSFPSGQYKYESNYLIGLINGVTFIKR